MKSSENWAKSNNDGAYKHAPRARCALFSSTRLHAKNIASRRAYRAARCVSRIARCRAYGCIEHPLTLHRGSARHHCRLLRAPLRQRRRLGSI